MPKSRVYNRWRWHMHLLIFQCAIFSVCVCVCCDGTKMEWLAKNSGFYTMEEHNRIVADIQLLSSHRENCLPLFYDTILYTVLVYSAVEIRFVVKMMRCLCENWKGNVVKVTMKHNGISIQVPTISINNQVLMILGVHISSAKAFLCNR